MHCAPRSVQRGDRDGRDGKYHPVRARRCPRCGCVDPRHTRPGHRHRRQGWACRGISALRPRYSCSDGELLALAAAAAYGRLPAEADLLRALAALLGIIWRDHGIVGRKPPIRQVMVRGTDRKSVVEGKRVSVRLGLGGSRIVKTKTKLTTN